MNTPTAESYMRTYASLDRIEATLHEILSSVRVLAECELQKEKNEGEKEKRDLPPAPPIESKAKEGEEKKDSLSGACVRVREENREADELFKAFWAKYPTGYKVAKRKCRDKVRSRYRAAKDKAQFVNAFLGGLDNWLGSRRWAEGVICNPETWINQERWLVRPEPVRKSEEEEAHDQKAKADAAANKALKELGL